MPGLCRPIRLSAQGSRAQSIAKGPTRESVATVNADLDESIERSYRVPTGSVLAHDGQRCPPKSAFGPVCRSRLGRAMLQEVFSEAPGQANHIRRELASSKASGAGRNPGKRPGPGPASRPT